MKRSLILAPCLLALGACSTSTGSAAVAGPDAAPSRRPASIETSDDVLRASYSACIEHSGGVVPAMQDCIAEEARYQHARLESAYHRLLAPLTGDATKRAEADQRAWLVQRARACVWNADEDGQGQRLEANACDLRMTAERARELEMRVEQQHGMR